MITRTDEKNEILQIFLDGLKRQNKLIDENRDDPFPFLAKKGSYFPPKLRKFFTDIYFGLVTRAILIGPRGGGKTYSLGDIAASLFLFKGFDVLIGSGGENQAKEVYDEVMNVLSDDEIAEYVPTMTMQVTRGRNGNWIRFLPASTKRARGPHPGRGHGGVIILDEEGEMEAQIVKAILGTGSTADPLIIIRASTFHKVDGTFVEVVDEAEKRGYTVYRWDAFDVAKKCPYDCKHCFKEFREDYCKGKAKNNSELGWISIDYLIQMWIEETKDWFETELMGMRPAKTGHVIDRKDLKASLVEEAPYVPGGKVVFGIDWGFKGMTGVLATQQVKDRLRVFDRTHFTRKGIDEIIDELQTWKSLYNSNEVCADSSHPFENDALRKAGFNVTEVTFVSFKEAGAGAVKWYFEKRKIDIPKEFTDLIEQLKKWKRGADGKIIKKDDHFPDALLCTMMTWWKKTRRKPGYTKATRR